MSDPDDDDRDGHRNVGAIRTPNAREDYIKFTRRESTKTDILLSSLLLRFPTCILDLV
jgi:hypothetical protein